MKRLLQMILSRTTFILLLLLAQIVFFFLTVNYLSQFQYVHTALYMITIIIIAYLIYVEENPAYKLSWIIPILIFPLFGGLFYLFYKNTNISKRVLNRYTQIEIDRRLLLKDFHKYENTKISNYLHNLGWPSYQNTKTTFLPSGEKMFEDMKASFKSAKSFIYLEFFIISPGKVWNEILGILKEKAQEGLDIKIIYDDFGSSKLPYNYMKKLKSWGIEAHNFNPMRMHLNFQMNYRDHRKIIIVDGKIGYTGGVNIGDEYVNLKQPFGHWQDSGIKLEGEAVYSLYLSFLEQLRFTTGKTNELKFDPLVAAEKNNALVIPFLDAPLDREYTTKNIYIQLISSAKNYIYITTPYLILDYEFTSALKFAARSGVKVKIIIPKIPDKRTVFMVTESYAKDLSEHGVEVYKYTPGFIHSKIMIVDGREALIGTVNLDFRSLYLHFENSVYLKNDPSIKEMSTHFEELVEKSMNLKESKKRFFLYRLTQVFLKGFSSIL